MSRPVVGAVLTGGASRRMGRDMAQLEVDGVAMARRVASALSAGGCDPVFAVGGDPGALGVLGLDVVADQWPGEGPLGAIVTALTRTATLAPGSSTFVAACDLPLLDGATVRALVAAAAAPGSVSAAVVAARTRAIEPLCAIWRPAALPLLRASFDDGERSVVRALERLLVATEDVDANALRNVNVPADVPPVTPR